MVILGGLEIVAAGYLMHKHSKNKKERQRLEAEAAALEEQQYRIYSDPPPASDPHRRHHSHERPNGRDDKHRYDGGSRPPGYTPQAQGGQPHAPVPAGYVNGAGYVYGQPAYQPTGWYAPQGQTQQPQGQAQQLQSKPGAAASYYQGDASGSMGGSQHGQYTGTGSRPNASSPHVTFAGPPPAYRP